MKCFILGLGVGAATAIVGTVIIKRKMVDIAIGLFTIADNIERRLADPSEYE